MVVCIYYITSAGNSIILQLGSSCHDNRYSTEKAGGTAHPSHSKSHLPVHSPPASKAGRRVGPSSIAFGLIGYDCGALLIQRRENTLCCPSFGQQTATACTNGPKQILNKPTSRLYNSLQYQRYVSNVKLYVPYILALLVYSKLFIYARYGARYVVYNVVYLCQQPFI
jgi:hypothetical protein